MTKKILIVADLDDTIFAREEQFEKEPILVENRGDAGNRVMKDVLGFDYMIENYFKNKDFPKDIFGRMGKDDLILTAGIYEFQIKKRKACNLENVQMVVVDKAEQKIEALIKYVKKLDFKPDLIEVYEDRPKYFIENKEYLEKTLNTKLDIYLVEMDGNRGYKKIELQK